MAKKKKSNIFNAIEQAAKTTRKTSKKAISQGRGQDQRGRVLGAEIEIRDIRKVSTDSCSKIHVYRETSLLHR